MNRKTAGLWQGIIKTTVLVAIISIPSLNAGVQDLPKRKRFSLPGISIPLFKPSAQDLPKKKPLTMHGIYPWQGQKGFSVGLAFYKTPALDVGFLISDLPKKDSKYNGHIKGMSESLKSMHQNIFLNSEFLLGNQHFIMGPKIGYEMNFLIFTARVSNVFYYEFDRKVADNRLVCEAGLNLYGFLNICYGYSYLTSKHEFKDVPIRRLTVRMNIFPQP